MNRRDATLALVHRYKELQEQFVGLCTVLVEALPPGNDYGIEIASGDVISRNISILGHPCKVVLGIRLEPEPAVGRITFQRLFPQDRTVSFFTAYFDRLGNATETPDDRSWPYSIKGTDITNWLAIRVLEEFFKSLATASEG